MLQAERQEENSQSMDTEVPHKTDMATVNYLCIGCPLGCRLEVDADTSTNTVVEVRGFSCRRGKEYAIQEHTAPLRLVTTTVAVVDGLWPRLPVRSREPVPKDKVRAICERLRSIRVSAPVASGAIIWIDDQGSGTEIVAARTMPVREAHDRQLDQCQK